MIARRQLLAGCITAVGFALTQAAHAAVGPQPLKNAALYEMLDDISDELLQEYPDDATFLGLDRGARLRLHSRLTDRSYLADQRRADACAYVCNG